MRITRRQLRQIIQESLPYRKGQPWTDPKAPVGDPVERAEDHLDRELTDDEIEAAMDWEPADPAGDDDFWAGYGDATDGKGLPVGASPDYEAGWKDGNLNRVTESLHERRMETDVMRIVTRTISQDGPQTHQELLATVLGEIPNTSDEEIDGYIDNLEDGGEIIFDPATQEYR
tara:strand:- start:100 stop:618 length:519 start_codon:yes stop_codon:yes gene_type:complete